MNTLIKTALTHIENEQIAQAKQKMVELYQAIKQNPMDLNKIERPDDFASVIATMLQLKVIDDDDEIERLAAIGYVVISKAIITNPAPNKNMFRLLILHFAKEQFSYTLGTALGFDSDFNFFSPEGQMVGNETANAIYEMEVYDLFTNPILYQRIPMFADAKKELDDLIRNNHFYNKNESQVIQEGREFHNKALKYLTDKILVDGDVE